MTNERAYTPSLVLHVLRNPHGWSAEAITAARLQAADEIERLKKREKDLMDVIDSRDRALGFVPLDEVHASEPRACGWRPIEAAPKGGAWVLLWWPDITDCAIVGYQSPYGWHSAVGGGYESGDKYGHPTHWMPLPKSPAEGASRDAYGHHCLDCGADLSNHPTAASAHRCSPQRTFEQRSGEQ